MQETSFEKLNTAEVHKKLLKFHVTRKFVNGFATACQWILYVIGRIQSKSHIQFISGSVQYIPQLMIGLRSAHSLSSDLCAFLSRVLTPYPSHHAPESSNYMTCTSLYSSLP